MGHAAGTGALEEWRLHWKVVLPCFLGIMLVSSHGYSIGVMIRPLEQEFGWPRAQISAGFLILSVMALLAGPIVGSLVDRKGARRIAVIGVPFYCGMLATLSLANESIWSWWVLWVLVALGSLTIIPVVWLTALNGYFLKSRGLAMAVVLSGTGLGAAIWPILTNTLVDNLGWRLAYVGLGAIGLTFVLPIIFLLFREAERPIVGSTESQAARKAVTSGLAAREQMASARFYKLAAAAIIFSIGICALTNNMVPILISEGLTPTRAAATAGLLGIGTIFGRLGGGFLLDRWDGNKVGALSVLLPIIPAMILLSTDQSGGWAGVACVLIGLSAGAELDACAYLAARHFGTRNFGTLFGTINGMLLFGAGIAPLAANLVFDITRSYDLVLSGLVPVFMFTAVLFLSLGSYRNLDQETGQPLGKPQLAE